MKISHEIISFVFTIQVTIFAYIFAAELGSSCYEDSDCHVENSRCYQKLCSCLPFYAAYNTTMCLQSNMLGFECLIPEQCSKKVANSTCIGGICRCESGFLQYRRHTCLTAAKIGEICYNDMHCRLSDNGSHCDFMIANLFGRCVCNAPLKLSRSGSCQLNAPPSSTSTSSSLNFHHSMAMKPENQQLSNKTSNLGSKVTQTPSLKIQHSQKTTSKGKPVNNDYKLINSTELSNKVKGSQKPASKPELKPEVKPENKPPNKFDQKQQTKPDRISKPQQKPPKKPDQKPLTTNQPNKPFLSPDDIIYQSLFQTQKMNKYGITSAKPESEFNINLRPSTTSKPYKSTSSNFFVNLQSKPDRTSNKNENKASSTEPTKSYQKDKILVVSNASTHHKKPTKNKVSFGNKNTSKNPFQSIFPYLSNKENVTSEETILRYPANVNKQIENSVKNGNTNLKDVAHNATSAVLTGPLHHRGAEDAANSVLSLGYSCKTDQQCMKNDNNSRCINGICDCVARRTRLENACSAKNRGCHKGTFQCKSTGVCISWFFVCDGRKDCADGSDENCKDKNSCPEHAFRCGLSVPAVCISQASRCDGAIDCPNGEDELNCTSTKYRGCPPNTFQCEDGQCLPEYEFCNAVITCSDGSDEPDNSCTATWNTSIRSLGYCPFRCANGRCRSSAVVCSGRDGCGDNSDENRCSICKCPPLT